MRIIPILLTTLLLLRGVKAHGLMTDPAQRGTLNPKNKFNNHPINNTAPIDYKPHFPAGDKDSAPGAGARSQIRAVPQWRPFQPMERWFRWRAGVCGDEIGEPRDHMRGGKYYGDGQIVKTFTEGAVIEIKVNVIAHHNGFMEFHICDVEKCGGEISVPCFKQGHCHHLRRAPNPSCDSGYDKRCAPIDPMYPHRWYLPCTTKTENTNPNIFGGPKMVYQLPDGLSCEHCVLHWFWSAANTCNPPGVVEFFEGEFGPRNWGECFGQGGAKGGFTKVQRDCGPDRFPEEYYQCADIRILKKGVTEGWNPAVTSGTPTTSVVITPTPTPTQSPTALSTASPSGVGVPPAFVEFSLVGDGVRIGGLPNGTVVDITGYSQVAIEAVTRRAVEKVEFFVDGELLWTDYHRRYFMFGNRGDVPWYWDNPIVNRFFEVRAVVVGEGEGEVMQSRVMFVKR